MKTVGLKTIDHIAEQLWQHESLLARGKYHDIPWSEVFPTIQEKWRAYARVAADALHSVDTQ